MKQADIASPLNVLCAAARSPMAFPQLNVSPLPANLSLRTVDWLADLQAAGASDATHEAFLDGDAAAALSDERG